MKSRRARGFTLVEILIVTVIFAVISLAIYSALSNGLAIWSRVGRPEPGEDVAIFLYRFTADIKNSFVYAGSALSGTEEECTFWTAVAGESAAGAIGSVTYRFDRSAEELLRLQQDYSEALAQQDGQTTAALASVRSVTFRYYRWDGEQQEYVWLDRWEDAAMPVAVRLEFGMRGDDEEQSYTKTVFLPLSS